MAVDSETGEVVGNVVLTRGGAARGPQIAKTKAFLSMLEEQGGTYSRVLKNRAGQELFQGRPMVCLKWAEFWTFGTSDTEPDRLFEWVDKLERFLAPRRYCLAIEAGKKGGRWHIHVVLEVQKGQELSPGDARSWWRGLTGIEHAEVNVQPCTAGGGAARYLAKYMGKEEEGEGVRGRRLFRASKGLTEQVKQWWPKPDAAWKPAMYCTRSRG